MELRVGKSLVFRLVAFVIALVLLDAGVRFFLLTDFLKEDLKRVVSAQQEALANYVARDVDQKIIQRRLLLKELAASLPTGLLGRPQDLRPWLAERFRLQPLFSESLFVLDTDGQSIADYPQQTERRRIIYKDRDYFRSAMAGQISIGSPIFGRVANKAVIPMSAPVVDGSGRVRAVLVGITAVDSPGFLALDTQSKIGGAGGFLLISPQDKLFVSATNPEMVLKPTPPKGVNWLHDKAMEGYRGSDITVNAQGGEEVSGIASVPSTGWFVVARIATSEAFATVSRTQRYLLINSVIVIVIFVSFAVLGLLVLFRPLLRAARHADRMTLADAPMEPLPFSNDDEVGHLIKAFNRLLAKLGAAQAELKRLAHHDALTNLPNRLLFTDRLTHELIRGRRTGKRIALLGIDLDGFKSINDTLGHLAGDEALVEITTRLQKVVRDADTLARVGGDEFVVLMCDLDPEDASAVDAARTVAGKCLAAVRPPISVLGEQRYVTLSIGIAMGGNQSTSTELQRAADEAMYNAKRSGGDRYVLAEH